jgi:hypothetical protein
MLVTTDDKYDKNSAKVVQKINQGIIQQHVRFSTQNSDEKDEILAKLVYPGFVNLSNIKDLVEYISEVALKVLISKLFDRNIQINHSLIIQSLE